MEFPLKKKIYTIYCLVLVAMILLLAQGVRQYQLYQAHEAIIGQTERLIFQFSIIREQVFELLLDKGDDGVDLRAVTTGMEELNTNLGAILANKYFSDEYKLTLLNSVDLAGIILLLHQVDEGKNIQENSRTLNQQMRSLGEHLILFDRVLVNNAKQRLISFQNIVIGSFGLIVFLLVTVLIVLHRNLIASFLRLASQAAAVVQGQEGQISGTKRCQEVDSLARSLQTLLARKDEASSAHELVAAELSEQQGQLVVVRQELARERGKKVEMIRVSHLAAIGDVAPGMAHEVSNLSNGIINYAQVLTDLACDPGFAKQRFELMGGIIREGEKIAALAKNLLAYGQGERVSRELADVGDVLENGLALMGHYFRFDTIQVKLDIEQLPAQLVAGRPMQQVILNILSNARYGLNKRYPGRDDNKILDIRGSVTAEGAARLQFVDHGCGIAADDLAHVFEPSFTTRPATAGVGFGLTVCQEIIAEQGGRITLASLPNEQTCVTVTLAKGR
ncbi:MAG: ATP-binding protein [Thermodesulfobacteriota bacterium]